jgi:hypothetical protein
MNTVIVGSNSTRCMGVSMRLSFVCVVLCVGCGLAADWCPVQGVLPTMYMVKKLKIGEGPKGYRERARENLIRLKLLLFSWTTPEPVKPNRQMHTNNTSFWHLTPYNLKEPYRRFGGTYYIHYGTEDEPSMFLWNVIKLLLDYDGSYLRRYYSS